MSGESDLALAAIETERNQLLAKIEELITALEFYAACEDDDGTIARNAIKSAEAGHEK